ncbi:MAG: 2,3-bisphosphoglycerate-independent phosphoglycerate mutase-domain-containing protein [Monoraphidium minutum]|nr:MAG: 2,3-bisphosphoglycerate-independent phosphoglycerate mutase-domain-containing protein [Monoraphidium minutum]
MAPPQAAGATAAAALHAQHPGGAPRPAKLLLLIIDGVGDVSIPAFGDRTPLQVAHTPNLDAVAAGGLNGLMDSVEPGLACGSDTSHMNILGYDPRRYYRGRGAFESMGAGLPMAPGDIAFKSNFATLNPATGVVEKRRADRKFEHLGPPLCAALDGLRLPSFPQHAVSVRYATEHRCGVVVRGPGLTDAITGTDPLKDNLPLLEAQPLDDSPEARPRGAAHTAAVVNELSSAIRTALAPHPINAARAAEGLNVANVVLLRGCGCRIKARARARACVPPFDEVHGMRACLVAPTKIIAGMGMCLGIEPLDAPRGTGSYDTDLASKAETACGALLSGGYDFALLHVKAVDDTGHDRMPAMKARTQCLPVRFLEAVDVMVGQIIARLAVAEDGGSDDSDSTGGGGGSEPGEGGGAAAEQGAGGGGGAQRRARTRQRYALCVTGDHSTPVVFGDHSHEPVPFALAHVRHAAATLGGAPQLALRDPAAKVPMPDIRKPPPAEELLAQAARQDARHAAAAARRPFDGGGGGGGGDIGGWAEAWPQAVLGDGAAAFDEVSAARGGLGRFPGSEVMPLLKRALPPADPLPPREAPLHAAGHTLLQLGLDGGLKLAGASPPVAPQPRFWTFNNNCRPGVCSDLCWQRTGYYNEGRCHDASSGRRFCKCWRGGSGGGGSGAEA